MAHFISKSEIADDLFDTILNGLVIYPRAGMATVLQVPVWALSGQVRLQRRSCPKLPYLK